MKTILFVLIMIFGINIVAKASINSVPDSVKINSANLAKEDIKKGVIKLLLQGGIAPKYFKNQNVMEKKYKLKYIDFGCVVSSNISLTDYNKIVARYLDLKYGKIWRTEVRKDVTGI